MFYSLFVYCYFQGFQSFFKINPRKFGIVVFVTVHLTKQSIMDIQEYLSNAVNAGRAKTLASSAQLTLGEMILKLEPIVAKQKDRKEEATVRYDFEYLFPTTIDSWRGSYAELALNFVGSDAPEKELTVTQFYNLLKEAIGKEFTGYKGGEFIMHKHTPVWVANYGNSGNTGVVEIVDNGYIVIIMTAY